MCVGVPFLVHGLKETIDQESVELPRLVNDKLADLAKMSPNDRLAAKFREDLRATCVFHVDRMADEAFRMIEQMVLQNRSKSVESLPSNTLNYPFPVMWFKCGNVQYYPLERLVDILCQRWGFIAKCNTSDTWSAVLPGNSTALYINIVLFLFDPESNVPKPSCQCHWSDPDTVETPITQPQVPPNNKKEEEAAAGTKSESHVTSREEKPRANNKKKTKKIDL